MTFKELEKLLKADGWVLKDTRGSRFQYTNPNKPGKVTVPNHKGDTYRKAQQIQYSSRRG